MKITTDQFRAMRDGIIRDCIRLGVDWSDREESLDNLYADYLQGLEPGDHAHVQLYTDCKPCTVIRRTEKSITVRYDKAEKGPSWKPDWIPGGFSAICTNDGDQKWIITEDPDGQTETFRWHSKERAWVSHGCRVYPDWRKYYDYNF